MDDLALCPKLTDGVRHHAMRNGRVLGFVGHYDGNLEFGTQGRPYLANFSPLVPARIYVHWFTIAKGAQDTSIAMPNDTQFILA